MQFNTKHEKIVTIDEILNGLRTRPFKKCDIFAYNKLLRPTKAWVSVLPSTYSNSPPTGIPWAKRVA
ncbi:hypothetical protein GCM10011274_11580 [Paraglaciecola chathamensis]|uniref:Uncharacterized protein n=1 Tax=Paraglaciecola chathamensis TaxID=368405 RepID=A0A8H9LZ92_9ALTE|nr:hypothetical protein GCM10011274_11580 [Paraglaciecola oceanifecundans]